MVIDQKAEAGRATACRTLEAFPDDGDLILAVAQAREGTGAAWESLIERFGGLVAAIARRCRLSEADVAEVCQTTWLRLVENLDRIEQPERLGAWLATTSRRESLRIATRRTVVSASDAVYLMADEEVDPLDAGLLREEQAQAMRMAAERLPPRCRRLLGLLMGDDDLPYKEIAEQLRMPIGSIGPTRGRCLEHLRQILAEMELNEVVGGVDRQVGTPGGDGLRSPANSSSGSGAGVSGSGHRPSDQGEAVAAASLRSVTS